MVFQNVEMSVAVASHEQHGHGSRTEIEIWIPATLAEEVQLGGHLKELRVDVHLYVMIPCILHLSFIEAHACPRLKCN